MRVLILGGDGYLGWPTAMYLSGQGHDVAVVDNFAKRRWQLELNVEPLLPILTLQDRVTAWKEVTGRTIQVFVADLRNYELVAGALTSFQPDAIVHYGQQPSAPYSMLDHNRAVLTQINNVEGTLNLLWAMKDIVPNAHLVKLGTMGEYGTPNIDIEEGFLEIEYKGRRDVLPFPKQPNSFYHLSKVHDSHNIAFCCKTWMLSATDLNQGIVYGIDTDETLLDERLATSFHYDDIFGTVLNRFCVEAVAGSPLTVYGRGGQKRGFLNLRDTIRCVELAVVNPAPRGDYRVFNQFTETFTVLEVADLVAAQAEKLGVSATVRHIDNPRTESEDHYYNPTHSKLLDLGLQPNYLSDVLFESMLRRIIEFRGNIKPHVMMPRVKWRQSHDRSLTESSLTPVE